MWRKLVSEVVGTAILVFGGLSVVIVMFGRGSPMEQMLPSVTGRRAVTGFLFGSIGAMIALSRVGKESGAHINPAVTLGFWLMQKLDTRTALGYVIAHFGSSGTAYSPQVFLLFGRFFYAGVGIGATKSDEFPSGDDWTDPWYAGRLGLDMLLLPRLHLDINANYRANAYRDLTDAELDAMTFGASLRFAF